MVTDEEPSALCPPGQPLDNVYALGDCCADLDRPLPALAQAGGASATGHTRATVAGLQDPDIGHLEPPHALLAAPALNRWRSSRVGTWRRG